MKNPECGMARSDTELTRSLTTLIRYLNKHCNSLSEWVPQVELVYDSKIELCVLKDGISEDPIGLLEGFGKAQLKRDKLRTVIVTAESVNDDLMVSATDSESNTSLAYVFRDEDRWKVRQQVPSEDLREVKTDRVPSVAVWRGIHQAK
jgi:hypothetical protein